MITSVFDFLFELKEESTRKAFYLKIIGDW